MKKAKLDPEVDVDAVIAEARAQYKKGKDPDLDAQLERLASAGVDELMAIGKATREEGRREIAETERMMRDLNEPLGRNDAAAKKKRSLWSRIWGH